MLAAGTSWLYPVQTGDKPIIALYPTAIICFEVGMLFAIIGTMVGMFLEMGLPALGKRAYDPAIAEGCIGICLTIHGGGEAVHCTPGASRKSASERSPPSPQPNRENGRMHRTVIAGEPPPAASPAGSCAILIPNTLMSRLNRPHV